MESTDLNQQSTVQLKAACFDLGGEIMELRDELTAISKPIQEKIESKKARIDEMNRIIKKRANDEAKEPTLKAVKNKEKAEK